MKIPWRKMIPLVMLGSILLIMGGMIALDHALRTPSAAKRIAASFIGAEYVDDSCVVLQTKGRNCGAAAMKMILDRYSIDMPLSEIDAQLQYTEKGTSLAELKRFAEGNHVQATGWRLSYEDFLRQRFPLILFVSDDHFVVADSVRLDTVYLRDPAIGRVKIMKQKLLKIWKGEALLFSRQ